MANPSPSPAHRFQPGQSGNPTGRPKARATAMLRAVITDDDLRAIWKQTIKDAKNGDKDARRDVFDRLEGKPVARAETGQPGDFETGLADVDTPTLKRALKRIQ